MSTQDVIELIALIIAALSAVFAGYQIRKSSRQFALSRAAAGMELFLQLDAEIRHSEELFKALRFHEPIDDYEIRRMMGLLERLSPLIDAKLVDPELVKSFHGWRFKLLVKDDGVRRRLTVRGDQWKMFVKLCEQFGVSYESKA